MTTRGVMLGTNYIRNLIKQDKVGQICSATPTPDKLSMQTPTQHIQLFVSNQITDLEPIDTAHH